MTIEAAILLGAVQGLTEFLPISSDGHLALGAMVLGMHDMPLTMVVALHAGTLVATAIVLAPDVKQLGSTVWRGLISPSSLPSTERGRESIAIVAASIPTAIIGLLLEERVEQWSHQPLIVGVCLLGSAGFVATTRRSGRDGHRAVLGFGAALLVGLAQGAAVLPGLSRSAATIATGMLLGLRPGDAFRFSFLLSLPAVGGALLLKLSEPGALSSIGWAGLVGSFVALGTGVVALLLLRRLLTSGRLWLFVFYLVPLGLGTIAWGVAARP